MKTLFLVLALTITAHADGIGMSGRHKSSRPAPPRIVAKRKPAPKPKPASAPPEESEIVSLLETPGELEIALPVVANVEIPPLTPFEFELTLERADVFGFTSPGGGGFPAYLLPLGFTPFLIDHDGPRADQPMRPAAVPEPATVALLALGLAATAKRSRRKRSKYA